MARTERGSEPREIIKGERIEWSRTFADYPATDYTLEYRFRGNGPGIDVVGAANGDTFDCTITALQSISLIAGEKYLWQAWITETADITNTWTELDGETHIVQGFVSGLAGAVDMRSPAKIILDALGATLLSKATADQLEYEIATPAGSRKLKRMGLKEILEARKIYAEIVARERAVERAKNSGKFGRRMVARLCED